MTVTGTFDKSRCRWQVMSLVEVEFEYYKAPDSDLSLGRTHAFGSQLLLVFFPELNEPARPTAARPVSPALRAFTPVPALRAFTTKGTVTFVARSDICRRDESIKFSVFFLKSTSRPCKISFNSSGLATAKRLIKCPKFCGTCLRSDAIC